MQDLLGLRSLCLPPQRFAGGPGTRGMWRGSGGMVVVPWLSGSLSFHRCLLALTMMFQQFALPWLDNYKLLDIFYSTG